MAKAPASDKARRTGPFEPFDDGWMAIGVAAVAFASASRRAAAISSLEGPSRHDGLPSEISDDRQGYRLDRPRIDRQTGRIELAWFQPQMPSVRMSYKLPPYANWRSHLEDSDRFTQALIADLEARVDSAWRIFRFGLDEAIASGALIVGAREHSPLSRAITEIPPEVWRHFEVTDWDNGVAEALTGDRLFSVHARPAVPQDTPRRARSLTAFALDPDNQREAAHQLADRREANTRAALSRELAAMYNRATSGPQTSGESIEAVLRRADRKGS